MTVIVPSRGHGATLAQALASVAASAERHRDTYAARAALRGAPFAKAPPVEVIVVDDDLEGTAAEKRTRPALERFGAAAPPAAQARARVSLCVLSLCLSVSVSVSLCVCVCVAVCV